MVKRQARQIDYQSLPASDLVWLAQVDGDRQAIDEIYARKTAVAVKIARNYCRRYTFVDVDDLSQSMLLDLPKIIRTYRPGKATDWDKYCYHRLFYTAKDVLRQRDDLGIGWPQKKAYPEWHHLGDQCFDGFEVVAKSLDEESTDIEKFYREIELWRKAFENARAIPRNKTSPARRDPAPNAWVDGKFFHSRPVPAASGKKRPRPRGLAAWRVDRRRPKQKVLFE